VDAVVSVILPARDAAPYLERCLGSLFAHTIPLQVIAVDDGSTDATGRVLSASRPPSRHSLTVLEQPNRGLGAARNAGLQCADGQFVSFVDADDWVADDALTILAGEAVRRDAELVIGGGVMIDDRSGRTTPFRDAQLFAELAARTDPVFTPSAEPDVFRLDTSACRRLYSTELLRRTNFSFAPGILFEDVPAHFELLLDAQRVSLVDRALYNYRINHPGRITDRRDETLLTVFDALDRSAGALRRRRAAAAVWGSLVWLQSWVVRWLASRIEPIHQASFARRAVSFGRSLPRTGVAEFQRRFAAAPDTRQIVRLQRFGLGRTLLALANGEMTAWASQLLALSGRFEGLAPFCGRLD
jgi:glycosyltransferase involved in cell wall biosynthesis